MVCDDRLGSANMLKVLKCTTSIRAFAESSGRATRKGSPTRVLENRANQLPQFSAEELAIHCSRTLPCKHTQSQLSRTGDYTHYEKLERPFTLAGDVKVRIWL